MQKKSDIRGRRSIRLRGWDYSSPNFYFITLYTQNRENYFGKILNGKMIMSGIGTMIEETWRAMQTKYSGITVDEFVVMPNHIHGILGLHVGAGPRACPLASTIELGQEDPGRTRGSAPTENRGEYISLRSQVATLNKISELENKVGDHDASINMIVFAIKQLMSAPLKLSKRIGFQHDEQILK
jgi:hypothetical protein